MQIQKKSLYYYSVNTINQKEVKNMTPENFNKFKEIILSYLIDELNNTKGNESSK